MWAGGSQRGSPGVRGSERSTWLTHAQAISAGQRQCWGYLSQGVVEPHGQVEGTRRRRWQWIRLVPVGARKPIPGQWLWRWRPDVWWSWGIVASVQGNDVRKSRLEKEGSPFAPKNSQGASRT